MRFRQFVAAEFARRRHQNARYSLRGFARGLGVHHATLSRLLRGRGPVGLQTIAAIGPRLGMSAAQVDAFVGREDEAALLGAIARPAFTPDSRWLASVSGVPVDRINIALQSLLRTGRLRIPSAAHWQITVDRGDTPR